MQCNACNCKMMWMMKNKDDRESEASADTCVFSLELIRVELQ